MSRYEVTYRRSDKDTTQRKWFDSKSEALQYARRMTFDVNDQFIGDVTASHVELWAIVETRLNITEAIHLEEGAHEK
jgi:hypothetical protein